MLRHLTTVTLGTFFALLFVLPGCDKKDDSPAAPGSSAQAPGVSGEGDKREKEHHDWDGGPHGEHPR